MQGAGGLRTCGQLGMWKSEGSDSYVNKGRDEHEARDSEPGVHGEAGVCPHRCQRLSGERLKWRRQVWGQGFLDGV